MQGDAGSWSIPVVLIVAMLPDVPPPGRGQTLRRSSFASARLAAECLAEMERRRPWFAARLRRPAGRGGAGDQTGVANFVEWLREPERTTPMTAEVF
ncbi:hypothetical protein HBB16_11300 [Pseudonocardia sp. MCCB 268]|nr:hypothetical protein [Pseudonocardia cytotoxica]